VFLLGVALSFAAFPLKAGLIITTSGIPSSATVTRPAFFFEIPITIGAGYTNVAVSASLVAGGVAGDVGTAFLTTQVGPGTTAADQVATGTFNFADAASFNTLVNVPVFSGLTVNAGTYYLVLVGVDVYDGISVNPSSTYTTAPGSSVGTLTYTSGTDVNSLYAPASTFSSANTLGTPFLTVTGDLSPTSVPEPSTALLFLAGLGGAAFGVIRMKANPCS
jgi:hypothetical protein